MPGRVEPPRNEREDGPQSLRSVGPDAAWRGAGKVDQEHWAAGAGRALGGRAWHSFLPGSPEVGTRLWWVHGVWEVERGGSGCRTLVLEVWQQRGRKEVAQAVGSRERFLVFNLKKFGGAG